MKNKHPLQMIPLTLKLLGVTAACAALPGLMGCSSTLATRSQNSDGLVEFLFDRSTDNGIPVEKVSGRSAEIRTAHLKIYGDRAYVSGLVARQGLAEPPMWAHVDVVVRDSKGKVVQGVATRYLPNPIPHAYHGQPAQSQYTVRLAFVPGSGSKIQVQFHNAHTAECQYSGRT